MSGMNLQMIAMLLWNFHMRSTRGRATFQVHIFKEKFRKGYVWKTFQIGSVILMTQIASQKKTELIDDFDLVWTINPQFYENLWKMEAISPKTALKIVFWRPPLGTKIPKMVQIFRRKFHKGSM